MVMAMMTMMGFIRLFIWRRDLEGNYYDFGFLEAVSRLKTWVMPLHERY